MFGIKELEEKVAVHVPCEGSKKKQVCVIYTFFCEWNISHKNDKVVTGFRSGLRERKRYDTRPLSAFPKIKMMHCINGGLKALDFIIFIILNLKEDCIEFTQNYLNLVHSPMRGSKVQPGLKGRT